MKPKKKTPIVNITCSPKMAETLENATKDYAKLYQSEYDYDEDDDPDASDGCCEECGCYHGHNPWCSEYDPAYTGDDNDW